LIAAARTLSYIPKLITLEKNGGCIRQAEHMVEYSEEHGLEHNRQAGPEYIFIPDQQPLQKGAHTKLSVSLSQEGHIDG